MTLRTPALCYPTVLSVTVGRCTGTNASSLHCRGPGAHRARVTLVRTVGQWGARRTMHMVVLSKTVEEGRWKPSTPMRFQRSSSQSHSLYALLRPVWHQCNAPKESPVRAMHPSSMHDTPPHHFIQCTEGAKVYRVKVQMQRRCNSYRLFQMEL